MAFGFLVRTWDANGWQRGDEKEEKSFNMIPPRWLAARLPDLNIGGVWLAATTKQNVIAKYESYENMK